MPDHRASTTDHRTMSFEGGGACVLVDLDAGGRCASFVVDGRELLVGYRPERDPFLWGSYPMAPFAGRLRGGSLRFGGMTWQLPQNEAARHAIHGYAWAHPWRQLDERTLAVQIGEPWPFPGLLTQRIELGGDAVSFTLELRADVPMPAVLGWHPWFARRPSRGRSRGRPSSRSMPGRCTCATTTSFRPAGS